LILDYFTEHTLLIVVTSANKSDILETEAPICCLFYSVAISDLDVSSILASAVAYLMQVHDGST